MLVSLSRILKIQKNDFHNFNCQNGITRIHIRHFFINFSFLMMTIHSEFLYVQMETDWDLAICTHDDCMAFRWAVRLIAVSLHCAK